MSKPHLRNYDRRSYTRSQINTTVKYKLNNEPDYDQCVMLDASHSGLLLSLKRELSVGEMINVRMESDQDYEGPIEIDAEIVRSRESDQDYLFQYGCIIREVNGF